MVNIGFEAQENEIQCLISVDNRCLNYWFAQTKSNFLLFIIRHEKNLLEFWIRYQWSILHF